MSDTAAGAQNWFTVETLAPDTFVISENRHWEETHCYLLLGTEKAVLIDTGLGVSSIRPVVEALTALPVLVLTTHVHWDHIGGHGEFKHFAVHEAEQDWIARRFPVSAEAVKRSLLLEPCDFPADFHADSYRVFQGKPERLVRDGDCIAFGGRSLTVVHTPGHSPGHCCFYEADRRTLYAGDLIYQGCLYAFYPTTDPLLFYQSVQKVRQLAVEHVYPGHHCLDISPALIGLIEQSFQQLQEAGKLAQGSGVFDFGSFRLHL